MAGESDIAEDVFRCPEDVTSACVRFPNIGDSNRAFWKVSPTRWLVFSQSHLAYSYLWKSAGGFVRVIAVFIALIFGEISPGLRATHAPRLR
jgi:hypothetical protein